MSALPSRQELQGRVRELTERLREAEEALSAIRGGEVDAIVVSGREGDQVFSLTGSDSVYRLIVESMQEAALTATRGWQDPVLQRPIRRHLEVPQETTARIAVCARRQKVSSLVANLCLAPSGVIVDSRFEEDIMNKDQVKGRIQEAKGN